MRLLIFVGAVISATACATAQPRLGEEVVAVAQVCFTVQPSAAPSVSFVSEGAARKGTENLDLQTSSGQGVLMAYGHEPSEGRALLVSSDRVSYFVFSVPRNHNGYESWSPWQSPDFETQDSMAAVHMAQGRPLKSQTPPGASAPYVRYKLMRFKDYLPYIKAARSETIPTCGAQQAVPGDSLAPHGRA